MRKKNPLPYKASSEHGNYWVVDMEYNDRPARMLFGDDRSPQSGMPRDDNPEMLFNYNQRFIEIVQSIHPKRVLVIGGGAFSLPMAIIERFEDTIVDVVEIDSILPDIARKFFNLTDSPRLNIHIQDGRKFIAETSNTYDLIVVDAFSAMNIPHTLLSYQAAELYKSALSPDGLVTINFISAYHTIKTDLAHQLEATFEPLFSSVEIYPAEHASRVPIPDNLVLVASKNTMPNLDYLQSAALPPLLGVVADVIHDPMR